VTSKIYDSPYIEWQIAAYPRESLAIFFKNSPLPDSRATGLSSAQLLYFMQSIASGNDAYTIKWLKACVKAMKQRYTRTAGFQGFRKSWSHDILTVGLEYFGPEFISDIMGDWAFKAEYFQDITPILVQIKANQKLEEFLQ